MADSGGLYLEVAGSAFTLMSMVVASFLRLVTRSKIFHKPTPIAQAVERVTALLAAPGVRMAALGPKWPIFRQRCLDKKLGGNDLPDAGLSAAVALLAEHLVSFDRDFRKLLAPGHFTLRVAGLP